MQVRHAWRFIFSFSQQKIGSSLRPLHVLSRTQLLFRFFPGMTLVPCPKSLIGVRTCPLGITHVRIYGTYSRTSASENSNQVHKKWDRSTQATRCCPWSVKVVVTPARPMCSAGTECAHEPLHSAFAQRRLLINKLGTTVSTWMPLGFVQKQHACPPCPLKRYG
ncbi:unnamed protein product, partial [Scytosiphon promiscuus]